MQKKLLKFIEYAILAPSTRNSQPWKFSIEKNSITIIPDQEKWLKVSDPKKSALYISVGCALENIRLSAENGCFSTEITYAPQIKITFSSENHQKITLNQMLFAQIPKRYTNLISFKNKPISKEKIKKLLLLPSFSSHGLNIYQEKELNQQVEELCFQVDIKQFTQNSFRDELKSLLDESRHMQSLLVDKLGQFAQKYSNLGSLKNTPNKSKHHSPLLGVISSTTNQKEAYVKSGQILQRIYLLATHLNLNVKPLGKVTEQHTLKAEVKSLLPHMEKKCFHVLFLLGVAPPQAYRSKRRPILKFLTNTA